MTVSATLVPPPGPDEYGTYYAGYIAHVPAGADILDLLARQRADEPWRVSPPFPRPAAATAMRRASGA